MPTNQPRVDLRKVQRFLGSICTRASSRRIASVLDSGHARRPDGRGTRNAGCAWAQTVDSSPTFEASTIRPLEWRLVDGPRLEDALRSPGPVGCWRPAVPYEGCVGGPGSTDPEQLRCEVSLGTLIEMAYRLDPRQFTPPDWMERSWWEVEAKVPPGTTIGQERIMAQNLLAEQFKLAAHFVKKEVPAYEMSVSKDGPKFKHWDFKVLLTPAPGTDPKHVNSPGSGRNAPRAADIRFDEDHFSVEVEGCDGFRHHRGELSMRQLAFYLSYDLDRPVVDLTELAQNV